MDAATVTAIIMNGVWLAVLVLIGIDIIRRWNRPGT